MGDTFLGAFLIENRIWVDKNIAFKWAQTALVVGPYLHPTSFGRTKGK